MTSIYVGNLAHAATEDDVRAAFEVYGKVSNVSIIKDRETGRPRGFAFVEMNDPAEAGEAIRQMNLKEILGRAVTVNEARPKPARTPRRGGGGYGGGRGRW